MKHSTRRLFGTDGIRGLTNEDPMTPEIALRLGKALAHSLNQEKRGSKKLKVVLGKDTRLSGYMFEQAICAGLTSMGADVLLVGPLPTPAIAFLTTNMRADAGCVISASHNPFYDNGIKFFDRLGFKLPDAQESKIEELVLGKELNRIKTSPADIGKAYRIDDARGRYVVFVKNTFPKDVTLDGLKIVIDCANGAAYNVTPWVFQELGADVVKLGITPDGKNINAGCGSLQPQLIREKVLETGADLGIALDGDADRVIFCDEKGEEVDGDKIMAIFAQELIKQERLLKNTLVATVMSNIALEMFINNLGGKFIRTPVGDRYVVEEMRSGGYNFGGEKSGHLIFLDHATTGDGTLAALQVLSIMKLKGEKLSELAKVIELFPQVLLNVRVREKKSLKEMPRVHDMVALFEKDMKGRGRVMFRYSGTEPLARIMVEGEDEKKVEEIAKHIAFEVEREIGL